MRIGLIGWFGAHNIGDELACHIVREGLQRRLHCEVEVLSTARYISAPHSGVISVCELPGPCFWSRYDALCWGPGGMLPGAAMLLQDHMPSVNIPQVVVSSSWPEEAATVDLLRHCRLLWSRIPAVATDGPPVIIAPDCAYALHVEPNPQPDLHNIVICPSAQCPKEGLARLTTFARTALRKGYRVDFYPAASSPGNMDILTCWELAKATGGLCYQDVPNWAEALYIIRKAALVVSFRKHPAIMAQLLGIPSVVCDYWGVFRPVQEVAGGDSLILGGPLEVGTEAQWLEALGHREVSFDSAPARARVNAALDTVADAIA